MTEKSKLHSLLQDTPKDNVCHLPERQSDQFCTIPNTGIVVDMEIQLGDPVDSQIISNFMGEFEQARKKI